MVARPNSGEFGYNYQHNRRLQRGQILANSATFGEFGYPAISHSAIGWINTSAWAGAKGIAMGWQIERSEREKGRLAGLLVVVALSILLTSMACHRNQLPKPTTSSEVPAAQLSVRLPQNQQELTGRLAVRDQVLRTGPMGPAFGWRMDSDGSSAHGWRWRHHRVESFRQDLQAATPQQRAAILLLAVDSLDKSVGANALIALAREGNRDALQRMLPIVDSLETPTTIRCAALETAALARGQSMMTHLTQLIDGALAEANSPDSPQTDHAIVAEAIRNMAVYRSVEEEPRFGLVLVHRAEIVQLAALEAWETPGNFSPPPQIMGLFSSHEPKVRAAALRVLAMRPIQGSYRDVARMLRDPSYHVQQAAAQAILALNTPEGLRELQSHSAAGSELVRASIATAFSQYGYYDAVYAMAEDKSWRVRMAVAEAIESDERPIAVDIATKMMADRSPQVQAAAISAVSNWPTARGGMLLLGAMKSNSFATREAARVALFQSWGAPEFFFLSSDPPPRRQQAIAELERAFESRFRRGVGGTKQMPEVPEVIELSMAMRRLNQADDSQRNVGLERVVAAIEDQPMTASQAKGIAKTLGEWGTSTPWAAVIRAMDDKDAGRAVLLRPALAGEHAPALHAACDHLALYPLQGDPKTIIEFTAELRRLNQSTNPKIAAKSIRALAATGDTQQVEWLARFLSSGDRQLRVAAAIGLVRLNDSRGFPALERLASEPNVQVRRALLEQLDESRDPRLAYLVVRLLNDRPDIGRLALQALNRWGASGLLPVMAHPDGSFLDQKLAWQNFARQGVQPPGAAPGDQQGIMAAGYNAPVP